MKTRLLSGVVLSVLAASSPALADNLISQKIPAGVPDARLTDGDFAPEGGDWQGAQSAVLGPGAVLVWDLEKSSPIDAIRIQADNNDEYVFTVSADGVTWAPLWVAPPVSAPGLTTRTVSGLKATGRFVRVEPRGGDTRYSISEVEVLTPELIRLPQVHRVDLTWGLWVLVTCALVFFGRPATADPAKSRLMFTLVIGAFIAVFLVTQGEMSPRRIEWVRAACALVACFAVLFAWLRPARDAAEERLYLAPLGVSATVALLCFSNFATPQFNDAGKRTGTFLHHYDMRTYFLVAKYLPELRFDGLYIASAAAIEDDRGPDAMENLRLRDLRTHEVVRYGEVREYASEVRRRFSPERWAAFKSDAQYFRTAMTDQGFIDSMNDHGGNATPVWLFAAWLMFGAAHASDGILWLGVLLDAALMLLAFYGVARAFGLKTALVAATLFGAIDFYMFGTNWFGATLRHDWLALWCLGICALKLKRPWLAGVLLGWSTLIRAFPALAICTVLLPPFIALVRTRPFDLRRWLAGQRDMLQLIGGVAVSLAVLISASCIVFGPSIWVDWWRKVAMLNAADHINNIAVRTWVTGPGIGHVIAVIIGVGLVAAISRGDRPASSAAFGVLLLPVVFSPANYYLHAVFLLAVCGAENEAPAKREGAWIQAVLLAMCFGSFFTRHPDVATHFRYDTYVLLAALGLLIAFEWNARKSPVASVAAPT